MRHEAADVYCFTTWATAGAASAQWDFSLCYNELLLQGDRVFVRKWWNWQTHHLEGVAPKGVGVQIPPSAPNFPSLTRGLAQAQTELVPAYKRETAQSRFLQSRILQEIQPQNESRLNAPPARRLE